MTIDELFEEFWHAFPRGRKTAKADARRKFTAIVKGRHKDLRATPAQLIDGARRYAAAMGDHHPYVKMPSTWLNGGCWEDEDIAPPSTTRLSSAQGSPALPERQSTRKRSLYEDLTDTSWAE